MGKVSVPAHTGKPLYILYTIRCSTTYALTQPFGRGETWGAETDIKRQRECRETGKVLLGILYIWFNISYWYQSKVSIHSGYYVLLYFCFVFFVMPLFISLNLYAIVNAQYLWISVIGGHARHLYAQLRRHSRTKFTTKMPHPWMSQLRTQTIQLYKDISLQQPRTPFCECTSIVPKLLGKGTHTRAHAKKPPTCGTVARILSRCCCCCCAAGQFALPFAPTEPRTTKWCEWVDGRVPKFTYAKSGRGIGIARAAPRASCGAFVFEYMDISLPNVQDDDVHMHTYVLYYDMPNVKIWSLCTCAEVSEVMAQAPAYMMKNFESPVGGLTFVEEFRCHGDKLFIVSRMGFSDWQNMCVYVSCIWYCVDIHI